MLAAIEIWHWALRQLYSQPNDTLYTPQKKSLKCNISMNNFLNRRIHMFGEYGTYGKIRAIKGKYDQIGVIKSK